MQKLSIIESQEKILIKNIWDKIPPNPDKKISKKELNLQI